MKRLKDNIILLIIIIGLGVVIYQNNEQLNYLKGLDSRQTDIYKETVINYHNKLYDIIDKLDIIESYEEYNQGLLYRIEESIE